MHRLIERLAHFAKGLISEPPLVALIRNGLTVGKNFHMLEGVSIDYSHCWHVVIGDDVTLAPNVHILAHDASTKKFLGVTRLGKVQIGDRVFVGACSIILPGVTIGDDVIVGAGSIVTRSVPCGVVVAGNPARVLCKTEEFLKKRKEERGFVPYFGEEFTMDNRVTSSMKEAMNRQMINGIGYIK